MAVEVDSDPSRIDFEVVHGFLASSYWAAGIPRETLRRAIDGSLAFGLYEDGAQIGFARVVSDFATFAYLADVFVLEAHRGRGHSRRLMDAVMAHPHLQGLRRWLLVTRDAHGVYAPHGFTALASPHLVMERHRADVYRAEGPAAASAPETATESEGEER